MKEKLVSLGFDTNGVDGIFGSGTDYAVRAFQGRCGLIADGITYISDISYILRGYDNIVEKLQNVGAKIELI